MKEQGRGANFSPRLKGWYVMNMYDIINYKFGYSSDIWGVLRLHDELRYIISCIKNGKGKMDLDRAIAELNGMIDMFNAMSDFENYINSKETCKIKELLWKINLKYNG